MTKHLTTKPTCHTSSLLPPLLSPACPPPRSTEEALPLSVDHRRYVPTSACVRLRGSRCHASTMAPPSSTRRGSGRRSSSGSAGTTRPPSRCSWSREHPELIASLEPGVVSCLGLLEPCSNIVVNTVIDHHWRCK